MAYIGRPSIVGNFVKLDAIRVVNGQAAYTMQNNSVNFADYSTVNQFLVSLNGTIQSPGSSFTVSGSTLTFASNLSTGDVIDFIIVFGNSLSAGVPTDATVSTAKIVDANVTTAKLADDSVTAAKINNDIISGSTELASEPADTDEFLVSDAGTLKRIDYSHIKASGGTTFLYATSASSASSISVSSTYITTTHDLYLIFLSGKMGTDNTNIKGRFLDSGGSEVSSNYKLNSSRIGGSSDYSNVATYFDINNVSGIGNDVNEGFNVVGWLQNPTSNTITTSFDGFINYSNDADSSRAEQFSMKRADGTEQHYGIKFFPNSGNFAEFKITVHGFNKS